MRLLPPYVLFLFQDFTSKSVLSLSMPVESEENKVFEQRNQLVSKVCSNHASEKKRELKLSEYYVNENHKLVWCSISKTASTAWFFHMAKLAGHAPEDVKKSSLSPKDFLHKNGYAKPFLSYLTSILAAPDYTSFIIVRDPFERLLSAFVDKISDLSVIAYDKIRCGMTSNREEGWCKPTFADFVNFVIEEHKADRDFEIYWETFNNHCSPCVANYTLILHMENLNKEETVLYEKVNYSIILIIFILTCTFVVSVLIVYLTYFHAPSLRLVS